MKSKIYFPLLFLFISVFILACSQDSASPATSDSGVGGSYARFMVIGDFLYVVDDENIQTFSLEDPGTPVQINVQNLGSNIESIFNLDGKLFIGSGSGLFVYTVGADGIPMETATLSYDYPIYPCDPVVATPEYAYVTLNTTTEATFCRRNTFVSINVLKIFDLADINAPSLIAEYEMFNPKGVGIDGELLFLCDDTQGLKIYDVSNPLGILLKQEFTDFTAFDVIPLDGLLLVVGPDNVYQFDYTDPENITLISTIPIEA